MFGGKKKISELEAELAKAREEAAAAAKAKRANVKDAEDKVKKLQKQVEDLLAKDRARLAAERQKSLEERKARMEESRKPKAAKEAKEVKEHVVEEGETLSHVALKYYGSATPPYWQHLLEHNKEALKGNERNVRTGMKLVIPELPEELKK